MKKKKNIKKEISVEIDKLTNSIENPWTGDVFDTEFHRLYENDKKQIKKKDWLFDWHKEIEYNDREVYKLTIKGDADVIQGLISFKVKPDHVFVHLIENAKFNIGKGKTYLGVAGNMFAFACKRSKNEGYDGYVSFIAKSVLITYYEKTIGAKLFKGQRMYLDSNSANKLINQYFKS